MEDVKDDGTMDVQWLNKMTKEKPLEVEAILDTKVAKRTRRKEYMEYLVKWKDRLKEDCKKTVLG